MAAITTRAGKTSPLTHNEVDANFTNLNSDKLDTAGIALGSAASPTIKFTGDLNTGIYSPGADQLAVATNGTGRLFVDASGNVGVGIASSIGKLVTQGNIAVLDSAAANSIIKITADTGAAAGATVDLSFLSGGHGPLKIITGGSERLRITSAGLVGIGTSSPRGNVSIANNADTSGVVDSSLHFGYSLVDYYGYRIVNSNNPSDQAAGLLKFQRGTVAAWVDSVVIDNSGNVGIGTSSPQAYTGYKTLEVNDTTGAALRLRNTALTANFEQAANATETYYKNILALPLTFGTNNIERLRITSAGLVGIGTSSPSYLLHVNTAAAADVELAVQNSAGLTRYGTRTSGNAFAGSFTAGKAFELWSANAQAVTIDSSGRLLVGTSTSRNLEGQAGTIQVEGDSGPNSSLFLIRNSANSGRPTLSFGKSRGVSAGAVTAVLDNDFLGVISWNGTDGTNPVTAAYIACQVDGTPGANDMPGRLVFSTTADGAASPTERMRIKSTGTINFSSVAVYADNAAAITGGLAVGDVYRTSTGQLMIRY